MFIERANTPQHGSDRQQVPHRLRRG